MPTVRQGESNTQEIKGRTIEKFGFKIVGKKTAVNTAVANTDFDLQQIMVKGTLYRDGRSHVLFNDSLLVLAMESAFNKAAWDYVRVASTTNTKLVVAAAGVSEVAMLLTEVDLGSPVNLSGSDTFTLEVNISNRLYATTMDTSGSFVEFDANEAVGLEYVLPYIQTKAIQGGESRLTLNMGDNVQRVVMINTDKTGVTESVELVSQFGVMTDRYTKNDNYREMLSMRVDAFPTVDIADTRDQSFELLNGKEFDKVQLDLTLVPTNINAGKNYIVTRSFTSSAHQVELADAKDVIHRARRAGKIGLATSSIRATAASAERTKQAITRSKK